MRIAIFFFQIRVPSFNPYLGETVNAYLSLAYVNIMKSTGIPNRLFDFSFQGSIHWFIHSQALRIGILTPVPICIPKRRYGSSDAYNIVQVSQVAAEKHTYNKHDLQIGIQFASKSLKSEIEWSRRRTEQILNFFLPFVKRFEVHTRPGQCSEVADLYGKKKSTESNIVQGRT